MPVERHPISVNQFCELLALDPKRFIGVERDSTGLVLVMEPEAMQVTGTFKELSDNTRRTPRKGGKKR